MRILLLQHVAFEGAGHIAVWAKERGHSLRYHHLYETGGTLPPLSSFDMLVAMGGPMGANDNHLPWMVGEKQLIRDAIGGEKYVLGVCLGAQLIANVLGARVYPNTVKEIGWFPIHGESEATVFHWHGDTFDLPEGAELIYSSDACRHQAFVYGTRVLAVQFHMEMDGRNIADIINHCRDEIVPSPTIQPESALRTDTHIASCRAMLFTLLDRLTGEK